MIKKLLLGLVAAVISVTSFAQPVSVQQKLKDIDKTINKILKDWNVPGCGIGIVSKDKLVFTGGYGYRNIDKKLPVTANTLFQIASNTKLFTATAVGFLVEEGKLDWDKPVHDYVPQIQFYNDALTAQVTIRDMLSHRTGISRHDNMWYNSDFTRQQLFDRIKYLEPSIPLRQGYLYNNLMYGAAGSVVEHLSGQTWEDFVTARIFSPLGMSHSMFLASEMIKQSDFMQSYYEKQDTTTLAPYPAYLRFQGVGPCGSIISSINDLSHWMIAQMHAGKYQGKQVIPASILKETMKPASLTATVPEKYFENLNSIYGMGRSSSVYKGHYRSQHSGSIGGIYSYISIMPADSLGIIVFTNGAHVSILPSLITNILYDKILGLSETPWSDRNLADYKKDKAAQKQARQKPDTDRVLNTQPSHKPAAYTGDYEDPAYGVLKITESGGQLNLNYNNMTLPLSHYHYDRFVSIDDEINGKWSLIFGTDAQGSISEVKVSLDEKEVSFNRKADDRLSDQTFLKKLTGVYALNGVSFTVELINKELVVTTAPPRHLVPYKGTSFRVREFADQLIEFNLDAAGNATALTYTYDSKTFVYKKAK